MICKITTLANPDLLENMIYWIFRNIYFTYNFYLIKYLVLGIAGKCIFVVKKKKCH